MPDKFDQNEADRLLKDRDDVIQKQQTVIDNLKLENNTLFTAIAQRDVKIESLESDVTSLRQSIDRRTDENATAAEIERELLRGMLMELLRGQE